MFGLGAPELVIILIVVLVIFGGTQIPKLARSMGQAQKEFKKGLDEGAADDEPESKEPEPPVAKPPSNGTAGQ